MSEDSDQNQTDDDFEIDLGEEAVEEETPEIEDEPEESEEESKSEEVVPAKKSGYVEFTTPEQKARVDEITRKRYEAERRATALEKELESYRKPPEPPKEVPVPHADPITEPEVFARQQQDRDKYIREHTKFESETESRNKQVADKEQARVGSLVEKYNSNMEKLGVNPKALHAASESLTAVGIGKDLTEFLLDHDDGPRIVAYLGSNLDDAELVIGMSPVKAAAYIEREIRGKLKSKPISKTPPPPTRVGGMRQSNAAAEADGTLYE